MAKFEGLAFKNQIIKLDGNEYEDCKFEKCELIYAASGPVSLKSCKFIDYKLNFTDSAQKTLQFMMDLYHGGFQELIETTFENIRKQQRIDIITH